MFFQESEAIARDHPDLGRVVQRIDKQLSGISSTAPLRPGDFACVLGVEENQVESVFELLSQGGVLLAEEMVECERCQNLMPGEDFRQAIEDEDEFECTGCGQAFSQYSEPIVIYRMTGEPVSRSKAEVVVRNAAGGDTDVLTGETSHGVSPAMNTDAQTGDVSKPVVDRDTFAVHYGGRTCELRNTKEFALFERINRRPGQYFSIDALIEDVWNGELTEKNTIQRTVSSLRCKLREAGFDGLEIDGTTNRGHYALKIPGQ